MQNYYDNDPIVFLIALIVIGIINFVPSFIAYSRDHPQRLLILIINLLMGWTIIGWGLLLIWASKGGSGKSLIA